MAKRRYKNIPKSKVQKLLDKPAINYRSKKYKALLKDLQAGILKHHKRQYAEYYFVNFDSRTCAIDCLSTVADKINSARKEFKARMKGRKMKPLVNVFLSYEGYRILGVSDNLIPSELAFRKGIRDRVRLDKSHLESWLKGKDEIHAVFVFAHQNKAFQDRDLFLEWLPKEDRAILEKDGVKLIKKQRGMLENPLNEALQFKDGISNPRYFPATSKVHSEEDQALFATTSFKLSPLKQGVHPDKTGNSSFSCGSYGAFCKFEIKEDAIDRLVKKLSSEFYNGDESLSWAHIMGRFKNGTPLTLANKDIGLATNNYDFNEVIKTANKPTAQTDLQGRRCPFYSHTRKANPRTSPTNKIQILRRGMFYQESQGQSEEEKKNSKGLLFISFQHSLQNQFEVILNDWMMSTFTRLPGDSKFTETGSDLLFGKPGDKFDMLTTWNSSNSSPLVKNSKKLELDESLIDYKGGLYFFAPCISFFKRIRNFGVMKIRERVPTFTEIGERSVAGIFNKVGAATIGNAPMPSFLPGTQVEIIQKDELKEIENKGPRFYAGKALIRIPPDLVGESADT